MRSVGITVLVVASLLFVVACDQTNTDPGHQSETATAASPSSTGSAGTDELATARALFKENCLKCHGEKGEGGLVDLEGTQIKVPNLTGQHARKPSDERLAAKITNGDEEMPAFKDKLSPQQIQDLVRFIRKGFQNQ